MAWLFSSWRPRTVLTIKEGGIDDTAVRISTQTARKLGLLQAEYVWVQYNKKKRPYALRHCEATEKDTLYMSITAQGNLSVQPGNKVFLERAVLPNITSINLYPLSDDIATFEGQLISEHVYPYFSSSIHPIGMDDFLDTSTGLGKFCVVNMKPNDVGLITPETDITLVRFGGHIPDYDSIDDVVECALELRRNVDYINTKWCAESLAGYAKGVQRLVDLLQSPPLYEEVV
ncbi:hypothetical protein BDV10DRAFT_189456 [Aspergillus recurvatus]